MACLCRDSFDIAVSYLYASCILAVFFRHYTAVFVSSMQRGPRGDTLKSTRKPPRYIYKAD
jgi:hypothetical protein